MTSIASDHAVHVAALTNHELLAMHVAVQDELKRRKISRTDSTVGELGEHIALRMYGGELLATGTKARDLIDPDSRRIQVKTRVKNRAWGQLRVNFKSMDGFDACLVLILDPVNLEPVMAREVSLNEARVIWNRTRHVHVSSFRAAGLDVLNRAAKAWDALGRDA